MAAENPEVTSLKSTLASKEADLLERKARNLSAKDAKENALVIAEEENGIKGIKARLAELSTPATAK